MITASAWRASDFRKFLCSLDFLVLLCQDKRTSERSWSFPKP